jgi:hypothetical protein
MKDFDGIKCSIRGDLEKGSYAKGPPTVGEDRIIFRCHNLPLPAPSNPVSAQTKIPCRLENQQTITLAKHAVFDPGQLLLDNEGPGLGGKQLQRRAIAQRGFGLAQPGRGICGLSSEDLLGARRGARDRNIVTYFSCSHWL